MPEILVIVASLAGVIAFAAAVLWIIDSAAKLVGARWTWFLLLAALPFSLGVVLVYLNRATLSWWECLLLPLAAPIAVAVVLLACLVALNPFDAIFVIGTGLRNLWRRIRQSGLRTR